MKKILTIDGGGIKGVFSLAFLSSIEKQLYQPLNKYFDLMVGTSTGGIIALGLGKGFTATELLEFYMELGKSVFGGNKLSKWVKHWVFAKYNNDVLTKSLYKKFGETRLGESKVRLVIPSQTLETGDVYLYKTAHNKRFKEDYKKTMVEIALATSAAPSYFPSFRSRTGAVMVDGGTYANNPIAIAAVEATGILNWSSDEIEILSIGSTSESLDINLAKKIALGKSYWAVKSLDLIMKGQSSAAIGMAKHLSNYHVTRIDEVVSKNKFKLDSIESMNDLKGLGSIKGRNEFQNIEQIFFSQSANQFEPIYKLK